MLYTLQCSWITGKTTDRYMDGMGVHTDNDPHYGVREPFGDRILAKSHSN
jgi:hypothetical protein